MSSTYNIFASGQSNMVNAAAFAWTPPTNMHVWNFNPNFPSTAGTAFVAADAANIGTATAYAAQYARLHPGDTVNLIVVGRSGSDISHWVPCAGNPDAWSWIVRELPLAMAASGKTTIDEMLWWQGEDRATDFATTYAPAFESLVTCLKAQSWFPGSTPIKIFSLAPTSITGLPSSDGFNTVLQDIAGADAMRSYFYSGDLAIGYWASPHMIGAGYNMVGLLASGGIQIVTNSGNGPVLDLSGSPSFFGVRFGKNQALDFNGRGFIYWDGAAFNIGIDGVSKLQISANGIYAPGARQVSSVSGGARALYLDNSEIVAKA